MPEFDFKTAIRQADNEIRKETDRHEKRLEFWNGYKAAMEEVERVQGAIGAP